MSDPKTKVQVFSGDFEVTSNLTVDTDTFHVDTISNRVGIATTLPKSDLDISGDLSISSDFNVGTTTRLSVDVTNTRVGFCGAATTDSFECLRGTNNYAIVGNTIIGWMPLNADYRPTSSSLACVGSYNSDGGYRKWGILQFSNLDTQINIAGTGRRLEFREQGTIKHVIEGTSSTNVKVGINTATVSSNFRFFVNGLVRQDLPTGKARRTTSFGLNGAEDQFTLVDWGGMDSAETNRITYNTSSEEFLLPVKGLYEISFFMTTYSTGTSSRGFEILIKKNGSNLSVSNMIVYSTNSFRYKATNTYQCHTLSTMYEFNANDEISIAVENNAQGIFAYNEIGIYLVHPT